jgi:hypothetical protein
LAKVCVLIQKLGIINNPKRISLPLLLQFP